MPYTCTIRGGSSNVMDGAAPYPTPPALRILHPLPSLRCPARPTLTESCGMMSLRRLPSSCAGLAAMPPATLITALPHPAHLLSPAFNWCRPWLLCQWHPPTWC